MSTAKPTARASLLHRLPYLLILFFLFAGTACGPDDTASSPASTAGDDAPSAPEATADSAILDGRVDRTHEAIGQLGLASSARAADPAWICTATLVAPRRVLTAAHCVMSDSGRAAAAGRLWFQAGDAVVQGARLHVAAGWAPNRVDGPWHDLAVLELRRDVEGVTPMRVATTPPEAGDRVTVVGYGVTRPTGPGSGTGAGTRRRATVTLERVEPEELVYDAAERGACYGDSGGPLYVRRGRAEEIVGVTSRGTSVDCRGQDIATRTDVRAAWILGRD